MALQRPPRRITPLATAVGVIVALVIAGVVALWPTATPTAAADVQPLEDAEVVAVEAVEALPEGAPPGSQAVDVTMRITSGPSEGRTVTTQAFLEGLPPLAVGQQVRVVGSAAEGFFIADYARGGALWALALVFVVVVVAASGWQGVRSLLGLVLSLFVVVRFIVPAILAGSAPATVALVGAAAVMLVTLFLSHGASTKTAVAVVGTTIARFLTVGLGVWAIDAAVITGFASEDAVAAQFQVPGLDLSGIVLAGLIIAALGVLDDVTVAQASTVQALHDTDPTMSAPQLFRAAMVVGRDHIASTVNTLFLAYAGASLALLVLFSTGGRPVGDILTSEVVAAEMVKTLVGSLGLVAAVPITTVLAAAMAVRRSPAAVEASRRRHVGHVH